MQTKPATQPQQNPFSDIFLDRLATISNIIQVIPPTLADKLETYTAFIALLLIAVSLPPLNPNQPSHKKAVPRKTSVILCGLFFL